MDRSPVAILYGLLMVAIIVGVDLLFLRDLPWLRLAVNIGIVVLFGVGYFVFFRKR